MDDTVQGRLVVKNIMEMEKLQFSIVQLAPALSPQYGRFENLISYMIPDALMEISGTSLSGKIITLIGFSGIGKEAAIAIRDVGGGKVIIVESDPNQALTASLNGFEVKSQNQALPISDFIILIKEQKLSFETMQIAKSNCIFASLEENPKFVNIDVEGIHQHEGVITSMIQPELNSYQLVSGQIIKVLSSGKTLNLPCATKMPGSIASSILTAHILIFSDIWANQLKYKTKSLIKPPAGVVNSVLQYHLKELKIEID